MSVLHQKTMLPDVRQVILLMIYKALLEIGYVLFVHPYYGYMGFSLEPTLGKFIESYFLVLIIFLVIPSRRLLCSTLSVHVLNVAMIIPMFSLYALKNEPRLYVYTVTLGFIITLIVVRRLPRIRIPRIKNSNGLLYFLLMGLSVVVYGALIYSRGLPSLQALDFSMVYEIRGAAETYGFRFLGYLVPWQAKVTNLFLLIIFWKRKNRLGIITIMIFHLMLYLITAHKSYFFQPLVAIALLRFIDRPFLLRKLVIGLSVGIIGVMTIQLLGLSNVPASMLIRRSLFVPAQLSFQYYEFFSQNEHAYLSHSFLSFLFDKPVYDMPTQRLIGEIYYRGSWANTGYLGDAFMNFGVAGVLLLSLFLGAILKLFDSLASTGEKQKLGMICSGLFMLGLTNGALFTGLLTGGILFFLVIFWLYDERDLEVSGIDSGTHPT